MQALWDSEGGVMWKNYCRGYCNWGVRISTLNMVDQNADMYDGDAIDWLAMLSSPFHLRQKASQQGLDSYAITPEFNWMHMISGQVSSAFLASAVWPNMSITTGIQEFP